MKQPNEIDFKAIGFGYLQTPYNVRCYYRNGKWGQIEVSSEETINIHIAATCLHYGQEAFEGLKAFRGQDGKIRLFRVEANAARMQSSAAYLKMAEPTTELFSQMVEMVIKLNLDYIPPFESGGSLYIRPVLIGTGAQVGVKPASEYLLAIFVTPVGSYFKSGMCGINAIVDRDHDRAAPRGTGHIKAGGNYGASLKSTVEAHDKGYDSVLYLDPKEHKYIDECGAANFFGIVGNKYVTPASHSILPSITNMSLQQLARDLGMEVEAREVDFSELSSFSEVGACGTAAVITPIASIFDPETDRRYEYKWVGPKTQQLYDLYRGIQLGTQPDKHNWIKIIE